MKPTDLIPTLLDLFPAFRVRWQMHQELWEGDDSPRTYLEAAQFSSFLIDKFECGDNETVQSAFNSLDSILTDTRSSSELAGLITVGILEGIYLEMSSKIGYANPLEKYMGPKTLEAWRYVEHTWAGKNSLAEVIKAELRPEQGLNEPLNS